MGKGDSFRSFGSVMEAAILNMAVKTNFHAGSRWMDFSGSDLLAPAVCVCGEGGGGEGGGGGGVLRISSDRDDPMGAKIQTRKNP